MRDSSGDRSAWKPRLNWNPGLALTISRSPEPSSFTIITTVPSSNIRPEPSGVQSTKWSILGGIGMPMPEPRNGPHGPVGGPASGPYVGVGVGTGEGVGVGEEVGVGGGTAVAVRVGVGDGVGSGIPVQPEIADARTSATVPSTSNWVVCFIMTSSPGGQGDYT